MRPGLSGFTVGPRRLRPLTSIRLSGTEISGGFFANVAWVTDTIRPARSAKERLLADIPNLSQGVVRVAAIREPSGSKFLSC
jgi:hypothetical protein